MQFLALLRRRTEAFSDADFAPLMDAEAEEARRLYGDGIVRNIWGRGDFPGAVIQLEADSEEAARTALRRLPLYRAEMLELTLIPLAPYRGFLPKS